MMGYVVLIDKILVATVGAAGAIAYLIFCFTSQGGWIRRRSIRFRVFVAVFAAARVMSWFMSDYQTMIGWIVLITFVLVCVITDWESYIAPEAGDE